MPTPANRTSRREPVLNADPAQPPCDAEGGGYPVRRRNMRRSGRAFHLTRRASQQNDSPYPRPHGDVRASSSTPGLQRAASASLPVPPAPPLRRIPLSGGTGAPASEADVACLPDAVRRAGEAYLDCVSAGLAYELSDNENDDAGAEAPALSYSQMVSALRHAEQQGLIADAEVAAWQLAPILNASDPDIRMDATRRAQLAMSAQGMLEREAVTDSAHAGGEMVESELRRTAAEHACAALRRGCAMPIGPEVEMQIKQLRAFVQSFDDKDPRHAALRVINSRIDPRHVLGGSRNRLVYENISGACDSIGLRDLAALVWKAIAAAPIDVHARAGVQALLVYNLADCVRDKDFVCVNGTFQRLLAPLDGIYPGVRTLARTPYELARGVALAWREDIARGTRGDNDADWQAFVQACATQAEAYFEPGSPLDTMIREQLDAAVAACRAALQDEVRA